MGQNSNLLQLLDDLSILQDLPYTNTMIETWENNLIKLLETEYGQESLYYQKLQYIMNKGFWRPTKGDPRGNASTPYTYQKEYKDQILEYKSFIISLK